MFLALLRSNLELYLILYSTALHMEVLIIKNKQHFQFEKYGIALLNSCQYYKYDRIETNCPNEQ